MEKSDGTKKPITHPEIIKSTCSFPGCTSRLCIGLCGKPEGTPKAVAHATHGNVPGSKFLSKKDFNNHSKLQNAIFYKEPHEVANPEISQEGTKILNADQQMLDIIHTNAKDK